jgi:DNA polymerase-3 subunit beta
LNSNAIIKAIDNVAYAVSKDKMDSESFRSIGFIFEEQNKLIVAGTDGHRLAACHIDIEEISIKDRFGIPKTSALHLKKLLKGNVLFDIVESKSYHQIAVFKGDNFILSTFLTDGNYPNVLEVINDWKPYIKLSLKLSKESITDALKPFVVNKKDTCPIKLTLSNNNLNILSVSNNSDVDIPVDYTGEEYTIGFNATYLLEAIDNICSNDIIIKLPTGKDYPAYIEPVNNCNYLTLVMPFEIK